MITVLGSLNMDIVARVDRYPVRGETKFGRSVELLAGGKGANQAAACGRLGKKAVLIGCVGHDLFGEKLLCSLQDCGVDTQWVKVTAEAPTGTTVATVDSAAENTLIVAIGANRLLTIEDVEAGMERIRQSTVLLVQMEIPHETALYAMRKAREHGVFVILDPAPADGVTADMLVYADLVTPNKQEVGMIAGIDVMDDETAAAAANWFAQAGVPNCIIKMGENGSLLYANGEFTRIPGIPVQAVDTIGAGDSFAGALATAIDDGASLTEAAAFAAAVSALKVTRAGAQTGLPTREELEVFCQERNIALYRT
ncbi:ribokinase [Paenibacillus thalictri]|uniref:Ribokinase n=1 Tax=Paenibacillus thalictri TaxID=2527873 RepID=A0A4Q9DRZ7_9BACL|nr:ribokinase [Paenibacillus thalictri]TBL77665.1 ribokinase [Paenibacillus thalictri]